MNVILIVWKKLVLDISFLVGTPELRNLSNGYFLQVIKRTKRSALAYDLACRLFSWESVGKKWESDMPKL